MLLPWDNVNVTSTASQNNIVIVAYHLQGQPAVAVAPVTVYCCLLCHLQAGNALPFLSCFLPLMKLLNDPQVQTSTSKQFTNPIYATLFHELDYKRVASMLQSFSKEAGNTPAGNMQATGSTASDRGASTCITPSAAMVGSSSSTTVAGWGGVQAPVAGCWVPADWSDVIEPFVAHLLEILRRFREDGVWEMKKAGATGIHSLASC